MTEETARIEQHCLLAPGIFDLILEAPEIAKEARPGQFVSVYLDEDPSRLLPRPISVCAAENGRLRLVYRVSGAGTGILSGKKKDESLRLLGPLGNGYPKQEEMEGKRVLLFGGGIGIPPLLYQAKTLTAVGAEVSVFLGYRDSSLFLADEFRATGRVFLATEDGSIGEKGNVLDAFYASEKEEPEEIGGIFSCGPLPMLRAVKNLSGERGIPCWLSLEERMACGVGACLGCVVKTMEPDPHSHVKNARVCRDGPVFPAEAVDLS